MKPRAPGAPLRIFVLAAVLLVSSLASLWPTIDPDAFTHLRSAEYLATNWDFPLTDPFLGRPNPAPYMFYSWLFELVLWGLHLGLGMVGHFVYRVVMAAVIALVLWSAVRRRVPHFTLAALITVIGVYSMGGSFFERPWLVSIVLFTVQLDVLVAARRNPKHPGLLFLPLLYILWANTHIQFIYGLIVLAFAVIDSTLSTKKGPKFLAPSKLQPKVLLRVYALCVLATLINPYHVRLYELVLTYAGDPAPFHYISELRSMEFRHPGDWAVLFLSLSCAALIGARRQTNLLLLLTLAFGVYFGFRSSRDTWLLSISATIAIAYALETLDRPTDPPFSDFSWAQLATALLLWVVLAGVFAFGRGITPSGLDRALKEQFPVAAVEHIKKAGYRGPILNHLDWGGYLLFALRDPPPSIDGRTTVIPKGGLERSVRTWAAQPSYKDDPDLAKAQLIIGPKTASLFSLLELIPNFKLDYEDDHAFVFVRTSTAPSGSTER